MLLLRAYLLAGLIAHKVLWEVLKRKGSPTATSNPSISLLLVKCAKAAILLGILVQTALPIVVKAALPAEIFPISADPLPLRIVGVGLYTIGLLTAILGRVHLGQSWSDIESPRAAKERAVVSHGVYAYVRHPIYSGDLMLLLGLELALNSWLVLGAIALIPVVFFKAVKEEKLLAEQLSGYADYIQRTKRFIPFVV